MAFNASIFEINKYRYPRGDLFVIMTVEQGVVKYLAADEHIKEGKFIPDSRAALVFDGFSLANRVFDDMGFNPLLTQEPKQCYIVPLAAIQILTGIDGGITPTHSVVSLEDD